MAYQGLCKAGVLSRASVSLVTTACTGTTSLPKAGVACKLVQESGVSKVYATTAGDTAPAFYGVTVMSTGLMYDAITGQALPNTAVGVLIDGFINVKCAVNTPMRGGKVYVNVTTGEFAATATLPDTAPAGTVEWPQAKWEADGKDSNNLGEIRLAK